MFPDLSANFPQYTDYETHAPVWCVTPKTKGAFHRFFDTSPISPSGRYLGATRLPFEDHMPGPGDVAEIMLVDLETGEEKIVAESRGWDTQLGAQVQWAPGDKLLFNDMDTDTWSPFCVIMDVATGETTRVNGAVYMASPDGKLLASPCLKRTGVTQAGYGVLVPEDQVPRNDGASADDGLYVTDVEANETKLLASFKDIVEAVPADFHPSDFANGDFWGFHVKWNPQGDRLMFVVRWLPHDPEGQRMLAVVTMRADGSDIQVPVPAHIWARGGHHPNWTPDGEHVMMNLKLHGRHMRFIQVRYDGKGIKEMTDKVEGSGHPSLHPNGHTIVTDAYPHEGLSFGDGTTPIRLFDLAHGQETLVARIQIVPDYKGPKGELRVDPHPAWDYEFKRVAFNAYPDGTRRVMIADLSEMA